MSKFTNEELTMMPDPMPKHYLGKKTNCYNSYLNILYRCTSEQQKYINNKCTINPRWAESYEAFAEDIMKLEHYSEWRNGIGNYKLCLKSGKTEYKLENMEFIENGSGSLYRINVNLDKIYTHPLYGNYVITEVYDAKRKDGSNEKRCNIRFINTGTVVTNLSYYHVLDLQVKDPYAKVIQNNVGCTGRISPREYPREYNLWISVLKSINDPNSYYNINHTTLSPEFYCFEYFVKLLPYLPNYDMWLNQGNTKQWALVPNLAITNAFTPYNTGFVLRDHMTIAQQGTVPFQQNYMYRNPVTNTLYHKVNQGAEICRIVDKDNK